MRGFDILVSETRSRTIYDLESETRDRASHSHAGARSLPPAGFAMDCMGSGLDPPHPVLVQAPIGVGGGARLARWRAGGPAANGVRLGRLRSGRAGPMSSTGQRSTNSSHSGGRRGGSDRLASAGLGVGARPTAGGLEIDPAIRRVAACRRRRSGTVFMRRKSTARIPAPWERRNRRHGGPERRRAGACGVQDSPHRRRCDGDAECGQSPCMRR
jgi:hypothetical protein